MLSEYMASIKLVYHRGLIDGVLLRWIVVEPVGRTAGSTTSVFVFSLCHNGLLTVD